MSAFTATRDTAWLMPPLNRRVLVIEGPDRQSWLNGLVTCDVASIAPETAIYGLAVQKNGRILSDLFVLESGDKLIVSVPASAADALARALDTHLIMEEATVRVGDTELCAVLGPNAARVAKVACKADPNLIARSYDGWGVPAVLMLAPESDLALREAAGLLAVHPGTADEWARLRTHGSIPEFGVDFDGSMYPQEAGLEKRAVSFTKGCYLGQEVVCMLEMRGQVRRKLVVLSYEGEPLPPNSKVLSAAGEAAGETRGAVADALQPGRSLGFAMVKRALSETGSELVVAEDNGASRVARVVERTWP